MQVVNFLDVAHLVTLAELREPVAAALVAYSRGLRDASPMLMFDLSEGEVHVKAATMAGVPFWCVKVSASVPSNRGRALPPAHSTSTLFRTRTGEPVLLIVDGGGLLTGLRTAAAGAVVARYLAPRTETLLVVGTGLQARLQTQAFMLERPFKRLLIWGRDIAAAYEMSNELRQVFPGTQVQVIEDLRSAVNQAQSIITATASRAALIPGSWLSKGQHVTAVGADVLGKRELDDDALAKASRLYVDSLRENLAVGDVAGAVASATLNARDITGELGELIADPVPRDDAELTVAKLVGLGVQDLAAAIAVRDAINAHAPTTTEGVAIHTSKEDRT